ncbi:MAG TPA: response regulator transcription factor [Actinomycetota bacterium]|nr:response regulator transcription factor [Actinomycetota bacterium]
MPVTVVIADDHQLVRQGLRRYLETAEDIRVVGEASGGHEAVKIVAELKPDVVVLDVRMDDLDGIEATKQIRENSPETGVVILTGHEEKRVVLEAVRAGARGYVLKARDAEHLVSTVRLVASGNMVIDPDAVGAVADQLDGDSDRLRTLGDLTKRELEVLRFLAMGHTNRQIAERLFISPDTVKTHLEHIYQKLGTPDRTAAVAEAMRRQIIE